MSDQPVRVRIAPSPTGYLHVGTARSALFNYLFARHTGGKFLVRIEDTDKERSKPEYLEPILDGLRWLRLNWDEAIVYQSQRSDLYAEYLKRSLDTGEVYYCFCSPQDLQTERDKAMAEKRDPKYNRKCLGLTKAEVERRLRAGERPAVRVRIPDGSVEYDDLIAGHLSRSSDDIEDFVIARSDGSVTYNFAVVVDDHEMGISHVIRGNDHITNTFKQVVLYRALKLPEPKFCHVPLILRPDKRKVSKRLGDKDVGEYRTLGILPEAMVNYLSLLGWSPKTDNEIYSITELAGLFELENLNASNAVFDEEKLFAFNRAHIQRKSDHELAVIVAPLLIESGLTTRYWLETRWEYLRQVISLLKPRVQFLPDFVTLGGYFFSFTGEYEPEAEAKNFNSESANLLEALAERFESLPVFTHESTEQALNQLAEEQGVGKAKIIHPARLAVSGMSRGPGLYEMLAALGQPIVVERLRRAVDHMRGRG
ncbi:MAG: glutamate--tRNA ligase [Candidatus Zixiibacteriota bacterium]